MLGTNSKGPKYEVRGTDKFIYKDNPKYKFGTNVRNTLNTGMKYPYYENFDTEVHFPITPQLTFIVLPT